MTTYSLDTDKDGYIDETGIPVINPELAKEVQKSELDSIVELFTLNLTKIGGDLFNFVNGVAYDGTYIKFGGIEYYPLVFESDGWEITTDGALPRPKIRLSRVNGALFNAISNADDLVNCQVIRTKTFRKYLDDGTEPNPLIYFPKEYYKIERKASANRIFIEFELSSALDNSEKQIPGRRILKNFCSHIYRRYNELIGAFDYSEATCQYTGIHFFDAHGNPVASPTDDICGKQFSDCKLRFSLNLAPDAIDFTQATEPAVFSENQYWLNTYYNPNRLYKAIGGFYSVYYKGSSGTPPSKDNVYFPYGEGDFWVDTMDHRLWRYETPEGQQNEAYNWYEKTVIASNSQPPTMVNGQYWHDTTNNLWYAYELKFYMAGYEELPFGAFPGAGGLEGI